MRTGPKTRFLILTFAVFLLGVARSAAGRDCQDERYCAPVEVQAQVWTGPSILVTWKIYNNVPDKVIVHRAPSGSGFPAERPPAESGFLDTSAAVNTLYSYQVCAHYDDQPYCSNIAQQWLPATASTGPLPPPVFNAPEVYQDHIRVSWNKGSYVRFNVIPTVQGTRLAQQENRSGVYDHYGTISGYTYTFSVQGQASDGRWSDWSAPLQVRVNLPPKAPGNFYVEGIVPNTHYRLHWFGYRDADMFRITRGRGSVAERSWNRGVIEPLAKREHEYEFDDTDQLAPLTEYWYEICASNISHQIDPINASCVRQTIKTLAALALAPADVRAAFVPNGAQLTWTANDDTVLWYEVERRDNMEWKIISKKLERHVDGKQSFLDANLPPAPTAYGPRIVAYRVCAGNVAGRACSGIAAAEVVRDASKFAAASVMRILQITPTRYAKAFANPPQIEVTLTYAGNDPKFAAYRSDGGQWVTTNVPLTVPKPGTAKVTIPSSVFQNSNRSVDVLLNNGGSQAFGTITVMYVDPAAHAPGAGVKSLESNLGTQGTGTPRAPGAPGREAASAPKPTPPLQQQAPKSSGPLFGR